MENNHIPTTMEEIPAEWLTGPLTQSGVIKGLLPIRWSKGVEDSRFLVEGISPRFTFDHFPPYRKIFCEPSGCPHISFVGSMKKNHFHLILHNP
jgi:hypothetical protein